MKRNRIVLFALLVLIAQTAMAKDEFTEVVHHIESHYHVHRNFRFMMGFAGMMVKVSHAGGVKTLNAAIFEDQQFQGSGADNEFDEVMRKALKSGWSPVVRTHSRLSGERTYIYARSDGRDLKILLATVEPGEAVVMEFKVNPQKLEDFIHEHSSPGKDHERNKHRDDDEDESAQVLPAPKCIL
ncbi:MAG TPA: hypothetical protein VNW97_15565 [Candidatus Saccharimonadales bacterium]|jgi:hypothetical protein|nr:hypothetical protein [Candidatus Saccharimonadales bacterium]